MFLHGRLGWLFFGMDIDRERRPPGHLHVLCAAFFQLMEEALDVSQGFQRGEDAHGQRQYGSHAPLRVRSARNIFIRKLVLKFQLFAGKYQFNKNEGILKFGYIPSSLISADSC